MDLKQYVQDAVRTESRIDEIKINVLTLQHLLASFVATGTMIDMIKKNTFYNKPIDTEKFDRLYQVATGELEFFRPIPHFSHPTDPKFRTPIKLDPRLFHAIIGAVTESAELADALNKAIDNDTPDVVNVLEEFGDINWYEAIAIDTLGGDFEELLTRNIAKLKARFPDKFTSENAIERDLDKERAILEGKQ
jgi:NTP pyrophosphatase (non-canonical NTP hydrolase)